MSERVRKVLAVIEGRGFFHFLLCIGMTHMEREWILGSTVNEHSYWLKRNKDWLPLREKKKKKTHSISNKTWSGTHYLASFPMPSDSMKRYNHKLHFTDSHTHFRKHLWPSNHRAPLSHSQPMSPLPFQREKLMRKVIWIYSSQQLAKVAVIADCSYSLTHSHKD